MTLALSCALGCRADRTVAPPEASYSLTVAGGNAQRAPAGSVLPQSLAVRVTDATGAPVKSARVVFHVQRGAASGSRMLDTVGVSSAEGIAAGELQLGAALDTTVVSAYLALASQRSVTLLAVATAAPALRSITPAAFAGGDTLSLRGTGLGVVTVGGGVEFGDVPVAPLPGATDSVVRAVTPACLAGGAVNVRIAAGTVRSNALSGTYLARTQPMTFTPYAALTVKSAQLADCLSLAGDGSLYLVAVQFASTGSPTTLLDWRIGSAAAAFPVAVERAAGVRSDNPLQREFEAFLRRSESVLAPRARAEAAAARGDAAYFQSVSAPPALGSTRAFKVVAALDGSRFTDVTARLRYVGTHLLLYADTAGAGFTDAQYQTLGTLFDRDLYPIAVAAFGSESDVDRNGRVLALFTPAVNALAPHDCTFRGFVTGFFYGNDLLVQNATSNKAEIFYSFVPDSAGVYSCAHTASDVRRFLLPTFVHELQHMISFNQHVLARFGDVEETWLNEGLSHIAEELGSKYYETRFPPPLGRSTFEQLFPDSAAPFIAPQLLNAYVYLNSPQVHSVTSYNAAGSIEERGATWLFLRWLAEQNGESIFSRLVQTSRTGVANVEAQSGEPFGALFGDFSLALFTDSLVGLPRSVVPPRFQFGSRDLRKLMARIAALNGWASPFPLPLYQLTVGGALQSQMLAGTMTHTLLRTAAGSGPATLRFSRPDLTPFAGAEGAQVSIFRLPP